MNNFRNKIEKEILSKEISLPQSLSAENIEQLINEKGSIIEPKRIPISRAKTALKWCASAAACIAVVLSALLIYDSVSLPIEKQKQDGYINSIVGAKEENEQMPANEADYSKIEAAAISYYQKLYNNAQSSLADDLLDGIIKTFNYNKGTSAQNAPQDTAESANGSTTGSVVTTDSADFGETNTQVEGVDEADIIKNDGRYIYFLANKKVIITDCADPENLKVVSQIEPDAKNDGEGVNVRPQEMFIFGKRLIIISTKQLPYEGGKGSTSYALSDCVYPINTNTLTEIYDISDVSTPKLISTYELDGSYLSSRITDGKLITVTNYSFPYYELIYGEFEEGCDYVKENCVPTYKVNEEENTRVDAENIKLVDEENPTDYIVTSLLDLRKDSSELLTGTVVGSSYEIYCSQNNLYITTSEYAYYSATGQNKNYIEGSDGRYFSGATTIHKYKITDGGLVESGSATVGGSMINQFSLDEYEGVLRVATNGNEYADGKDYWSAQQSMVYTLDEDMKVIGYLGGIAEGENMKSARFLGEMLYLVTFVQTDPLFAIDLSDAENPEILGELKIPGFSTYLHPVGNGLLIGTGVAGTETGATNNGKISLFDVSNPAELKELDNYTTDTDGYFSDDHKAFVVIDENTFMVPFVSYSNSDSKLILFSTENNSITVKDQISFMNSSYYSNNGRATFIGKNIFAVNNTGIVVCNMETGKIIGTMHYE